MTALLLALLLWTLPHPLAAQGTGSVTLLEGPLKLIRGTTVYQGVEGMHLKRGDILETSENGFAQLEFASGIIALGPQSRLYILPAGGTANGRSISLDLIVLNGWLKSEAGATKALYRIRTPLLAVSTTGGAVVARSSATGCDVYVESGGSTSLSEVNANGDTDSSMQAKAGQFFPRQKGAPISVVTKPSAAFLDSIPRQFRDTLPSRQGSLSGKPTEPKAEHAVSYDEIEAWLRIPSSWRRGLAERFSPRLSDASFRKQIESHVREFPEWDALLHPKKSSESP